MSSKIVKANQKPQTQLPFEIEQESLRYAVGKERSYTALFAAMGLLSPIGSLVFKEFLDPTAIACILGFGMVNTGGVLAALESLKMPERYLETFENANKETLKKSIAYDINYTLALGKINAQRNLAYTISALPEHEHKRWVEMYALGGILPPPIRQTAIIDNENHNQIPNIEYQSDAPDIDDMVQDFNYLEFDDQAEFIKESKAVFGSKGSGKSSWMAYEGIQFVSYFQNGLLLIGDCHADNDVENSKWLPFVDEDRLVAKHLATTPDRIYKQAIAIRKLFDARRAGGIKEGKPFFYHVKWIVDEFVGTLKRMSDYQQEFIYSLIQDIEFEGRKYGFSITLGLHSIKKEQSGLDSSILASMTVLALGTSISDPTIKFPADFDTKALLAELDTVNAMLAPDKSQGMGCVVRRQNQRPCVSVVPPINLPTRQEYERAKRSDSKSEDMSSADLVAFIKTWLDDLEFPPSDEMLTNKWLELTGEDLTSEGLRLLKELLGIE